MDQFNTISAPGTTREVLGNTQKQLVNFSVRAQDFILKKGLHDASTIDVDDINVNIGKASGDEGMNSFLDESIGDIKKSKAKKQNFLGSSQTPHGVF